MYAYLWYTYIFFFSIIFNSFYTLYFNHLNFLNKVFLNEFFLNNTYFLWISLWYIPIFIILILWGLSTFHRNISFLKSLLLYLIGITLMVSYFTYINCTFQTHTHSFFPDDFNNLLLNSINKLHPFLLYTCLLVFFWKFLSFSNLIVNSKQKDFYILSNSLKIFSNSAFFAALTLLLGSWWALQEGSWGGWWNWDFSEVFGLVIFIKLVTFFHIKVYLKSLNFFKLFFYFAVILLITYYLMIQINFTYVSHNFGFRSSKFLSTNIFLNVVFLCLTCCFYYFYLVLKKITLDLSSGVHCNLLFMNFYLGILLNINFLFIISLLIIVNDFFWNNVHINIFNYQINFNKYLKLVFIYLYLSIFKFNSTISIYSILYFKYLDWLVLLLLDFFKRVTLLGILHNILFFSLLWSLIYILEILNIFEILSNDYFFKEIYTIRSNLTFLENNFNLINLNSSFELKSFSLSWQNFSTVQSFYPLNYLSIFRLETWDMVPLLTYFFSTIIIVIFLCKNHKLIMF